MKSVHRFFVLAYAAAALPAAALDLSFGGSLDASYAYSLPGNPWPDAAGYRFLPLATASGSLGQDGSIGWELRAEGRVEGKSSPSLARLLLDSASARLLWGPASLELGWGVDAAPAAEVLPQATFLGPSDPLTRLESAGTASDRRGEAFAKAGLALGDFHASFLCAPFRPELVLPDLASPWFPSAAIPRSFFIGTQEFTYEGASFASDAGKDWTIDPAYLAEAGAVIGPMDLGMRFFHGLERQASFWSQVSVVGTGYDFHVDLTPKRSVVDAVGLYATAVVSSLRVWLELANTWNASLPTGNFAYVFGSPTPITMFVSPSIANFTDTPPIVQRDRLAGTLGASWSPDLASMSLRLFAEGTWSHFLDAPPGIALPSFSRSLAAGIEAGFGASRVSAALDGMISLADMSCAFKPSLGFGIWAESKLELYGLFFLGSADEEFGQYAEHRSLGLTLTQNF